MHRLWRPSSSIRHVLQMRNPRSQWLSFQSLAWRQGSQKEFIILLAYGLSLRHGSLFSLLFLKMAPSKTCWWLFSPPERIHDLGSSYSLHLTLESHRNILRSLITGEYSLTHICKTCLIINSKTFLSSLLGPWLGTTSIKTLLNTPWEGLGYDETPGIREETEMATCYLLTHQPQLRVLLKVASHAVARSSVSRWEVLGLVGILSMHLWYSVPWGPWRKCLEFCFLMITIMCPL